MRSAAARAPIRYHGSKRRLARWIVSHFPEHAVYTEAYGGSAAVLMAKPRATAEVYNDLDGRLVSLFRALRDPEAAAALKEALRLTPYSRAEYEAATEPAVEPVEDARRLLVRAYMGFGSDGASGAATGFRTGLRPGKPPAAADWANYPDAVDAFTARLRGVVMECQPALDVIRRFDKPGTLHYVDPPYVRGLRSPNSTRTDRGYRHEMSDDEHRELAAVLRACHGYVVLSGYVGELYSELYDGWTAVSRDTLADQALPRTEVLWLSPSTVAAHPGLPSLLS